MENVSKKSEPWSSKVTYRFSIDVIKAAPVWSSYHGTSLTSVQPPKWEKKAVAVTKSVRGTCVKGERAGFYQDSLSLFSGSRFMFLNLNLWSLSLWSEMGLGVSRCYWQQASYAVLNGAGYHCCHNMAAAGSLVLLALMVSNPHRAVIRLLHVVLPFASSHLFSVVAIKAFLWSKTLETWKASVWYAAFVVSLQLPWLWGLGSW